MDADEIAGWFSGRLRELRVLRAWTQAELAEKAGLTQAGIANLEQGRTGPEWSTVIRLCVALGVKCDEFQRPPAAGESRGRGRPMKELIPVKRTKGKKRN